MPLYKYKVANKDGSEVEETKEFENKSALYSSIRKTGGAIIASEAVRERKINIKLSFLKKVKTQELIAFANNLAVMLDAGLSVSRALAIMVRQSKNKFFINVLEEIATSISQGETLSKSLSKHASTFPGIFVSMIAAGEESGKMAYSLRTVSSQLEKSYGLTKKIKGAMIYPSVIISLMLVIGVVLMVYMVPTLTETFKGLNIALPLPTRIIIAISDFMRANLILLILGLGALVAGVIYFLKTEKGGRIADWTVLHMPMFGTISREVNAARTTRTMSSLVSSGVDIVEALNITSNVLENSYFKDIVKDSAKRVEVGELLSATLTNKLYPIFVSEMLSVGEETGKMTEMLTSVAVFYEGEIDQKTKDLSTIIEPFLMILIGIAVGIFAIAMMLPTYSLVNAIQ